MLAADRASGHTNASQVLDMVREARACVGCSAEAIDALVVAYGVTESVVVYVSDVAATTASDAAQVWTGSIAGWDTSRIFDQSGCWHFNITDSHLMVNGFGKVGSHSISSVAMVLGVIVIISIETIITTLVLVPWSTVPSLHPPCSFCVLRGCVRA